MKLTKREIDRLPKVADDRIIFDDELAGFGIRLAPSGKKTFIAQYRQEGRTRRVKLGVYGHATPEEARKHARRVLGEVAAGGNPAETIRRQRIAPTVGALCDRFLEEHVAIRLKPATQREYRRNIERFIRPHLGMMRVEAVTRPDIAQLHHSLRDRPYQANRVLEVVSKMFNLAEVWGLRPDGSNPRRHIAKYPEQKKERFLNDEELERLGATLAQRERDGFESPYVVAAFRMLILTGCRLGEMQRLKWSYIKDDMIHLPDSKTGARRIPLPPAARSILQGLPRHLHNDFVFVGEKPGAHVSDLQNPWQRIRRAAGLDDVRIHDLRHTYASVALRNGESLPMIGKLLGHSQIQTTMRYAHLADGPVRDAAVTVSTKLSDALCPRVPELVPVPGRASP